MVKRVFSALCFLTMVGAAAFGQTSTGRVLGVVSDKSGGIIVGAKVTITNTGTGAERSTITGSQGAYELPALQVGTYALTVEQPGFKKYSHPAVVVTVNEETRVDAVLEVGQTTSEVTVTGVVGNFGANCGCDPRQGGG